MLAEHGGPQSRQRQAEYVAVECSEQLGRLVNGERVGKVVILLVDAVGGGQDPELVDEHAAAPVAEEAERRMEHFERHLPREFAVQRDRPVDDARRPAERVAPRIPPQRLHSPAICCKETGVSFREAHIDLRRRCEPFVCLSARTVPLYARISEHKTKNVIIRQSHNGWRLTSLSILLLLVIRTNAALGFGAPTEKYALLIRHMAELEMKRI